MNVADKFTTIIKIKHIEPNAQYMGNIYDYYLIAELNNNQLITIFDYENSWNEDDVGTIRHVFIYALEVSDKFNSKSSPFLVNVEVVDNAYLYYNSFINVTGHENKISKETLNSNKKKLVFINRFRMKLTNKS